MLLELVILWTEFAIGGLFTDVMPIWAVSVVILLVNLICKTIGSHS